MTDPDNPPPALARQADADFGLLGGTRPPDDDEPTEQGPQPDDIYDPAFFQV